ncbi:MAG: glycosyltransferase family 4 protein [Candidatus Promineifilaceae bacterium]|nr:glycosyltransferase family 4 protein [Candidatus Promineifilaceae bacterium]
MKDVLFIAYIFPPHGGGGVQRTTKFVKYLPRHGWRPTVLAARHVHHRDPSLLADVPAGLRVRRTPVLLLPDWLPYRLRRWVARWIFIADMEVGWYPFATRAGRRLLREESFSALYSTSGPYTGHLVGLHLKRRHQIPWIADFRDAWIGHFQYEYPTPIQRAIAERMEKAVVHTADRVVAVNEGLRRHFLQRYPELPAEHFVTIPNGFDPDDYHDVTFPKDDERFTIIYTGSLYGNVQTARPFLQALRQALADGRLSDREIRVRFIGNAGVEAPQLVAEWGLEPVVDFLGYLPHSQVIGHQLTADALLLILGEHPHSEVVLPGKTFEYLYARRPILAMIPDGVTKDVLSEASVGHFAAPDRPDEISVVLVDMVAAWRRGELAAQPDPEVIARYDRRRQAQDLASLFEALHTQMERNGTT